MSLSRDSWHPGQMHTVIYIYILPLQRLKLQTMSNATQALGLLQTTRCPPSLSLHRWWLCHLQNTHPLWDIKYIKIQQYIHKIYRYSISKRDIGLIISPWNSCHAVCGQAAIPCAKCPPNIERLGTNKQWQESRWLPSPSSSPNPWNRQTWSLPRGQRSPTVSNGKLSA